MFVGKVRNLPKSGAPERYFNDRRLWPYTQILDLAG